MTSYVYATIIAFVCILCFYNTLYCGFVFDDISAIKENRDLRPHSPLRNVFLNDFWGTPMHKVSSQKMTKKPQKIWCIAIVENSNNILCVWKIRAYPLRSTSRLPVSLSLLMHENCVWIIKRAMSTMTLVELSAVWEAESALSGGKIAFPFSSPTSHNGEW